VKEQLAAVLLPVLGEVSVENLHALTGGASRTTWAFDARLRAESASGGDPVRSLILRTGPPDDVHAGMELEAAVQQRARPSHTSSRQTIRLLHWVIRISFATPSAAKRSSGGSSAPLTSPAANGCCSSARRRWQPSIAPTPMGWA